jgi:phosphoglycolate phosphatase-like HAD superfamily hydrolase
MDGGRAFFLDFDHTLFDTDRFFWVDVRATFAQFRIDARSWEESYEAIWPTGYSLEKHLEYLADHGQVERGVQGLVKRALENAFADLRLYLFPDVEPFLARVKRRGIHLFLLSFGDPSWQGYKVKGAQISDFFQEIFTTEREEAKVEVVGGVVRRFPQTVVVDNNPRELDRIKAVYPQLTTVWINRVPPEAMRSTDPEFLERFREARRYATLAPQFHHRRCQTLDEVY